MNTHHIVAVTALIVTFTFTQCSTPRSGQVVERKTFQEGGRTYVTERICRTVNPPEYETMTRQVQ